MNKRTIKVNEELRFICNSKEKQVDKFELCAAILIENLVDDVERDRKMHEIVPGVFKELIVQKNFNQMQSVVGYLIGMYLRLVIFKESNFTSPCPVRVNWLENNMSFFMCAFDKHINHKKMNSAEFVKLLVMRFRDFFSDKADEIKECKKKKQEIRKDNRKLVNSFLKTCQEKIKKGEV